MQTAPQSDERSHRTVSDGTGLQGMADRLAALGGELTVVSSPGEGTTVGGHIPIRVMEAVG